MSVKAMWAAVVQWRNRLRQRQSFTRAAEILGITPQAAEAMGREEILRALNIAKDGLQRSAAARKLRR